jgi:hypothetical protein
MIKQVSIDVIGEQLILPEEPEKMDGVPIESKGEVSVAKNLTTPKKIIQSNAVIIKNPALRKLRRLR